MMSRHASFALLASLCMWGAAASAQSTGMNEAPVSGAPDAQANTSTEPPVGAQTHAWVRAQAQREQASRQPQAMSGAVMQRVHERYLKSFETPVPTRVRDSEPIKR